MAVFNSVVLERNPVVLARRLQLFVSFVLLCGYLCLFFLDNKEQGRKLSLQEIELALHLVNRYRLLLCSRYGTLGTEICSL